jgi:uridine kinase
MKRSELIAELVSEILARKNAPSALRVAIDGRCGSGKTMLAEEIAGAMAASRLGVLRSSVDEFHHPREHRYRQGEYSARGYYEDAFDYPAILKHVSRPVPSDAVLLFDGVFVLRQELARCWDVRILVDVDAETTIARAVARDRGDREIIERKYRVRYEPAWRIYADEEEPERKADLIVRNQDVENPMLTKK